MFGNYKIFKPVKHGVAKFNLDDYLKLKKISKSMYSVTAGGKYRKLFYVKSYRGRNNSVRLHRLITNCPEGLVVDHIDGDGLNNCRENLEVVTIKENVRRGGSYKPSKTSKYKGIYRIPSTGKYRARIFVSGKQYHLGCFDCEEQAKIAYDNAYTKYQGL